MQHFEDRNAGRRPARHGIRRILVIFVLIALGALTFRLFHPIFVWSFGWQALPESQSVPTSEEVQQPAFAQAATVASAVLREMQKELQAPAVSAAVGINGSLAWRGVVGYADMDAERLADFDSRFRIGSTSKAITSVAIGTLLENARLDLDASVRQYVPYFPEDKREITTRQVMSHTAGFRNYGLCLCFPIWEYYSQAQFNTMQNALGIVMDDDLLFEPGTDFAYTSLGYNVTGAVTEGASGQDFLAYLQGSVLEPLGMDDTSADYAGREVPNRVSFYEVEADRYKPAYPTNNSIKWPSGGLVSTPTDMVTLGNALLVGDFLSRETRSALFKRQQLANGEINEQNYALGWRNSPNWRMFDGDLVTTAIHHNGTANGSTSVFVMLPEFELSISVMMNRSARRDTVRSMVLYADRISGAFITELRKHKNLGQTTIFDKRKPR